MIVEFVGGRHDGERVEYARRPEAVLHFPHLVGYRPPPADGELPPDAGEFAVMRYRRRPGQPRAARFVYYDLVP